MNDNVKSEEEVGYEKIFYRGLYVYIPNKILGEEDPKKIYIVKKRLLAVLDKVEALFKSRRITLKIADIVNVIIFKDDVANINNRDLRDNEFVGAFYHKIDKSISIGIRFHLYYDNFFDKMVQTLIHEIGHAIQDNFLRKIALDDNESLKSYLESSAYKYFYSISEYFVNLKDTVNKVKNNAIDLEEYYSKYKDDEYMSISGISGIDYILSYLLFLNCTIYVISHNLIENNNYKLRSENDLYNAIDYYTPLERYKFNSHDFKEYIENTKRQTGNSINYIISSINDAFEKKSFLSLYYNFFMAFKDKEEVEVKDFLEHFSYKKISQLNGLILLDLIVYEIRSSNEEIGKIFHSLDINVRHKLDQSKKTADVDVDWLLDTFLHRENEAGRIPKSLSAYIKREYEENVNLYDSKAEALEEALISIFPTEYGSTNEEEHFSELFMKWVTRSDKLMQWEINLMNNVMTISRAINNKEIMKAHKNNSGSLLKEYIKVITRLI